MVQKWIYGLIIAITWVTAGLVSIGLGVLEKFKEPRHYFYLWNSFNSLCLLIICISYAPLLLNSVVERTLNTMVQPVEKEN